MIQYHPIPYDELQFNAIPCNAALYHLITYNAMQYHAKQYYTLQYHAIACHTVELILTRRIRDSYYCSVTEKAGLTHYPTANTLSNGYNTIQWLTFYSTHYPRIPLSTHIPSTMMKITIDYVQTSSFL